MLNALKKHWPECLMEAAELGLFMISASLFTILLYHPGFPAIRAIPAEFPRRVLMGIAMGLTAIAIVYSPWGKRSGAHMNPAVTLTFFRLGKVAPWDAVFYVIAQFTGGIAGVALVALPLSNPLAHPAVNYVATLPGPAGPWTAFAAEIAISGLLVFVVLTISNSPRLARLTGLCAGICVAIFITFESPISGMSMNPARTLASAVLPGLWNSLWIYFFAPPLGMLVAAELFPVFKVRVICAKLHHQNSYRCIFCEYHAHQGLNHDPAPDLINTPLQRRASTKRQVSNRFSGFLFVATLILTSVTAVNSQTLTLQSPETQTALLELYTSEGCSSCPPAERWLSALKDSSALWKDFVPVAFHVDYWDYLGWRDPWSAKTFSERQSAYAQSWGSDSVYTPGFVLNGKEWRGWSGSKTVSPATGRSVGMLKATSTDLQHWQVSFFPANHGANSYEIHAALLDSGLTSDVKAGENRGRRLVHDFVVSGLVQSSCNTQTDHATCKLNLPAASQKTHPAVAFWVTAAGHLEAIQAVGGYLHQQTGK